MASKFAEIVEVNGHQVLIFIDEDGYDEDGEDIYSVKAVAHLDQCIISQRLRPKSGDYVSAQKIYDKLNKKVFAEQMITLLADKEAGNDVED